MTSPASVRIELDSEGPFLAGETVRGRAVIQPHRGVRVRSATARASWRVTGEGNDQEPVGGWNELGRDLQCDPGQERGLPFALPLPPWPVSYAGTRFSVDFGIEVRVRFARARQRVDRRRSIVVRASPASLTHQSRKTPDHTSGTHGMTGGLCCALALAVGGTALGLFATNAVKLDDSLGAMVFAVLLWLGALLALWAAMRNWVAERKLGEVFVGIDPLVAAGGDMSCLVRFKHRVPGGMNINKVTAVLTGTETAIKGSGKHKQTLSTPLLAQTLTLTENLWLAPGDDLELEEAFRIPARAPHSFEVTDNKIEWKVEVRVDIPGWPDWVHTYPVLILPSGLTPLSESITIKGKVKATNARALQSGQICPYCRDSVSGTSKDSLTTCASCKTTFHRECIRELGACTTRGCRNRGGLRVRD